MVEDATKTETDEEVIDFLKQYGHILKTQSIDDPTSAFHHALIVEYSSGAALVELRKILPYEYLCEDDILLVQSR